MPVSGPTMFKKVRILLLLFALFVVATGSWLHQWRLTDWNEPLWLVVYPIAGDDSPTTRGYIDRLALGAFHPIEDFVAAQARQYRRRLGRAVRVVLGPEIDALPPAAPVNGSILSVVGWSLSLRYWAWRHESDDALGDVSMFVIYHDPERSPRVPHSLGLKQGSLGVVHAFADRDMTQSNNVVITHEFLHTLGATDKYDPRTDQPLHPHGFAAPGREPLYPQDRAEIMGGRIPLSPSRASIPRSLSQTVVGALTAQEIGW